MSIRGGMELNRKDAIKYHIEMWTAMMDELGDSPEGYRRTEFKRRWCSEHFPNDRIWSNCFLCEYCENDKLSCEDCPIDWGAKDCVIGDIDWHSSPISEILALPERDIDDRHEEKTGFFIDTGGNGIPF